MRITKSQLQKIIKEELQKMSESDDVDMGQFNVGHIMSKGQRRPSRDDMDYEEFIEPQPGDQARFAMIGLKMMPRDIVPAANKIFNSLKDIDFQSERDQTTAIVRSLKDEVGLERLNKNDLALESAMVSIAQSLNAWNKK